MAKVSIEPTLCALFPDVAAAEYSELTILLQLVQCPVTKWLECMKIWQCI